VKEAVMATMAASRKDYCAEVTMMEAHRGGKRNEKEKCFFLGAFVFLRACGCDVMILIRPPKMLIKSAVHRETMDCLTVVGRGKFVELSSAAIW
jgi:hypothetical protein